MPYLIKYRKTRLWISNIKKTKEGYEPSFNKFMNKAKYWKTEKGVRKAIETIIKSPEDYDNYMIVYRTNSEMGIWEERSPNYSPEEYKKETENQKEEKPKKIKSFLIKIKDFLNRIILYIKTEIKFYFP